LELEATNVSVGDAFQLISYDVATEGGGGGTAYLSENGLAGIHGVTIGPNLDAEADGSVDGRAFFLWSDISEGREHSARTGVLGGSPDWIADTLAEVEYRLRNQTLSR
jgi:hypothetical protein